MPYNIRLPDGTLVQNIPDSLDPADAKKQILKAYPDLAPKPETGFLANVAAGGHGLLGDLGALGAVAGVPGAEKYAADQREKAEETASIADISEHPWEYVKGLAGRSLPYMAAPLVAGLAAPEVAVGTLGGAAISAADLAAGAVSAGQFAGSNVTRQLEEGKAVKDVNVAGALAAAPVQAALDVVGFRFLPGIRGIFSKAGAPISEKDAIGIVSKYIAPVLKTAGAEGATEAAQQVFERAQAGLNIADPQARKEYFDSFVGGAVLGGAIHPIGSMFEGKPNQTPPPPAPAPTMEGIAPAPTPAGLPDTYEQAVQEVERLKQAQQTEEVKARIAQLEAYKNRLVRDEVEGHRRQPNVEPTSLADQIQNQSVTQGEFRETMGLPTREVPAEPTEAVPEKEMPTVLDSNTLDATGLSKRSGLYQRLLNKDLTNLEDLDAVTQLAQQVQSNPGITQETKQALDSIVTQAHAIYGKQADLFENINKKLTPVQKKIAELTAGKDLTDPAQVEEIRAILTDYANAKNRSQSAISQVDEFLQTLPSSTPEATDVLEPTEPVADTTEPSPTVVSKRRKASTAGTEGAITTGLGTTPAVSGEPAVGETVSPDTLSPEEQAGLQDELQSSMQGDMFAQPTTEPVATEPAAVEPTPAVAETEPVVPAAEPAAPAATVEKPAPIKVAKGRLSSTAAINELVNKGGYTRSEATQHVNDTQDINNTVSAKDVRAMYRTGDKGKKGIAASRVQRVVDSIISRWKNAPPIKVVQSVSELPEALQAQIIQDKVKPPGAFDPNTGDVYLISDNIVDEYDAALTMMHEVMGHYGLRGVLGNTYAKVMDDIYNGNITIRKQALKKMAQGLDKHTAVEEVLAEMAEKGVYNNGIQRVMNAIRQFLRSVGMKFEKVTDNEIRALLANANRFVYSGEKLQENAAAPEFKGRPLWRTHPETLTPEGQNAAALLERMKGISNPRADGADTLAKGMAGVHHFFTRKEGPSATTLLRRAIADKDASVNEKLEVSFNNKLIDSVGNVRADLLVDQAQDVAGHAENYMDNGGIKINEYGLVQTYKKEGAPTMKSIVDKLHALGDKLGSKSLAVQVAHNALIANRANEIKIHNAKVQTQIDAALAKKNTKAAEALEKTKVTIRASQAEIDAGLEAMRTYPEIKTILNEFTEYKNGLVDFMVECGRINEETARNWKENAGYVPWTRLEEEVDLFDQAPVTYKSGLINISQLPKLDREGSSKEIANVFDNMIGLTNWAIKTGMKTRAVNAMAEQLPDAVELKTDDELKREQKNNRDRVIYTYKNGERTAYLLGSAIDMSAFSSNIETLGPIMQAFKFTGDFLRGAITHMPAFAVSQLIQDGTYRGMMLSGVEKPFSIPPKVFKNFGKALRGELSEIQALGITGVYDGMPEHMMERAQVRYGLKERASAKKAWDKLEKFSLAADLAVRAAIYEQTIEETKSATMPEGDQRLALYRAKEYINFKRAGASPTIRTMRHIVPFMNAYIQGMDVLFRTMQGKGISLQEKRKAQQLFFATGLKMMALSAVYTMLASGDDDYEGLEDYERDRNYIIPGTGIKIPVAPELGFMFKVIPERILRYIVSQGTERPQDAETFYKGFRDAFITAYGSPGVTPQLVKPGLEVMVNYSFFTSNPIVGQSMKNVDPSLQFNAGTSEFAKLFGMVGLSPMKVDYLIRGYTGMAGAIALDLTDAVANPDRMSKPINKLPQVSTFMYDTSGRGYKSDFYKFRESVDEVVDTVNLFKREGRAEELQEYLTDDKLKMYAMQGVANKIEGQLAKIRQYRNIVTNDPQLSGDEKRQIVDDLQAQEKELILAYNVPQLRKMAKE